MIKNIVPVITIENPLGLASKHSREQAWLTITNHTNKPFSVHWIDYNGVHQSCEPDLEPFGTFTQNTFATHPFVLSDMAGVVRHLVVPVKGDCVAYLEPDDTEDCEAPVLLLPEPIENATSSRSLNSETASFLMITNKTDKEYKFIWLNFDGQRVEYESIKPHETTTQCTFQTHPWILGPVDSSKESLYQPQKGVCRIELNA